jgi:hypothetical protein
METAPRQLTTRFLLLVSLGKDMAKLLRNRNAKLRSFAAERTTLTPAAFDA